MLKFGIKQFLFKNKKIMKAILFLPFAILLSVFIAFGCDRKEEELTSPEAPVIVTIPASELTQVSAITGGEVTSDGGDPVTERGVCWSTNNNPTINDNKTVDGSGTGNFVSTITGLEPKTIHYYRAYATNNVETSYGEVFQAPPTIECEGRYDQHLQGITGNKKDLIYWCFTTTLVKTNLEGKVLKSINIPYHHGDLCFANEKIYVAWSDKFNEAGANSKVYIYDANDLNLLDIKPVPEATFGAGGIEYYDGHFYVVGGLPINYDENYVFQYDDEFNYVQTHVIASGYTNLGIQTVCFNDNHWWFGCYTTNGKKGLIKTDISFNIVDIYDISPAIGLVGWGQEWFLMALHFGQNYQARVVPMVTSSEYGLSVPRYIN